MSNAAYEKIKATEALPSPSGVATEILQLAQNEETTLREITRVIETDAALASRLLKVVNSPFAGQARSTASVAQAVSLLGLETIKGIALGFSFIGAHKEGECEGFDYEAFWSESAARAVTARHLANKLKVIPADEALTCGLLSQIGRLAFATAYPKSYAVALQRAGSPFGSAIREVEREMFDIDHNELAAAMMDDWHLPALFGEAVRAQGSVTSRLSKSTLSMLTAILSFGESVWRLQAMIGVHKESLSELTLEAIRLGIRPDGVAELFDSISAEWRTIGSTLDVSTTQVPDFAALYTLLG